MKKIRKVLVALAFSDYAKDTFRFAAQYAHQNQARLVVANVIDQRDVDSVRNFSAMGYDVDSENYVQNVKDERQAIFNRILTATRYTRKKVQVLFLVGNPVEALLQTIAQEDIDVVIMGIKGGTDVESIMIGSVAEKLFRKSPVTVISFRDEKSAAKLRKRFRMM